LDSKAIREALVATKLTRGPAMIVGYDAIEFDQSGQNKHAALVMIQINDIGKGMERITVWPKVSRRANYKPVFPTP
jgi:branched-chain amino acid transport system substrate-binding protein